MSNNNPKETTVPVTGVLIGDRVSFRLDDGRAHTIGVRRISDDETGKVILHDFHDGQGNTWSYAFDPDETVTLVTW
jgi:hypothetical protein